jgi:hypothetical protein
MILKFVLTVHFNIFSKISPFLSDLIKYKRYLKILIVISPLLNSPLDKRLMPKTEVLSQIKDNHTWQDFQLYPWFYRIIPGRPMYRQSPSQPAHLGDQARSNVHWCHA